MMMPNGVAARGLGLQVRIRGGEHRDRAAGVAAILHGVGHRTANRIRRRGRDARGGTCIAALGDARRPETLAKVPRSANCGITRPFEPDLRREGRARVGVVVIDAPGRIDLEGIEHRQGQLGECGRDGLLAFRVEAAVHENVALERIGLAGIVLVNHARFGADRDRGVPARQRENTCAWRWRL